jgi:Tol biopolymer transport system component
MPEGKRLIFTTYDATEGSSAFWAVDVETGNRTLLADRSMILGRVTDFAISPDGLKIAYVNDLEQLWILVLGE